MLRRIFLGFLLLLALIAASLAIWEPLTAEAPAAPAYKPTDVRIARDSFGVPHIFGKTDADVAYGVAYAHAEDDFSTLQEVLAMTRGRAGAMLGQEGAKVDYAAALLGVRATAKRDCRACPPTCARCSPPMPRGSTIMPTSTPTRCACRGCSR